MTKSVMIMIIETISFTIPFPGNIPTFAAPPPPGAESNHIGRGRGGGSNTLSHAAYVRFIAS